MTFISMETIRVIVEEADITYQHTKTWKASNDPDFEVKKTNPVALPESAQRRTGHLR